MKRLFWKEWHECWPWFLLWLVAVVVTAAFGVGQTWIGQTLSNSIWNMAEMGAAVLCGLLAYTSETTGERATFLYSRAQLWKSLLFAKVALGLATAVAAAALGALAIRLCAPTVYQPFITTHHLLMTSLAMAGVTSAAYMIGLCCSLVISGIAGSIVTGLIWVGMLVIIAEIEDRWTPHDSVIGPIFAMCSALFAAVIIARFGLTLTWPQRLLRFILITGAMMLTGFLLALAPPVQHLEARLFPPAPPVWEYSLSPRAHYAVVSRWSSNAQHSQWIDLTSGAYAELPGDMRVMGDTHWITDSSLYMYDFTNHTGLIYYFNHRKVQIYSVPDSQWNDIQPLLPSPDARRLLKSSSGKLFVMSLANGRTQNIYSATPTLVTIRGKQRPHVEPITQYWWQDDHTVGYIEPLTGKRILTTVK